MSRILCAVFADTVALILLTLADFATETISKRILAEGIRTARCGSSTRVCGTLSTPRRPGQGDQSTTPSLVSSLTTTRSPTCTASNPRTAMASQGPSQSDRGQQRGGTRASWPTATSWSTATMLTPLVGRGTASDFSTSWTHNSYSPTTTSPRPARSPTWTCWRSATRGCGLARPFRPSAMRLTMARPALAV